MIVTKGTGIQTNVIVVVNEANYVVSSTFKSLLQKDLGSVTD